MIRKLLALLLLFIATPAFGQYYGSSNQVYRAATGNTEQIERVPGPTHWGPHPGCKMCLGNHLISSHGYSYNYLNSIGWQQWQTLHDNAHNGGQKLLPIKKIEKEKQPIYAPTPQKVVDKMIELADIQDGEVFADLGCGDGRLVIAAQKANPNCYAYGYEIKGELVKLAKKNAEEAGIEDVRIYHADIFKIPSLDAVDVVTLYLEEEINEKLIPQLQEMKPGAKIISYHHKIPGIKIQDVYSESRIKLNYDLEPSIYNMAPSTPEVDTIYVWKTPLEFEEK